MPRPWRPKREGSPCERAARVKEERDLGEASQAFWDPRYVFSSAIGNGVLTCESVAQATSPRRRRPCGRRQSPPSNETLKHSLLATCSALEFNRVLTGGRSNPLPRPSGQPPPAMKDNRI